MKRVNILNKTTANSSVASPFISLQILSSIYRLSSASIITLKEPERHPWLLYPYVMLLSTNMEIVYLFFPISFIIMDAMLNKNFQLFRIW